MKKLLLGSGLAALLAFSGGAVQAADQEIELSATVAGFCTTTGAASIPQAIPTDSSGNVVDSNIDVNIGDIVCNGPTDVQLSSANGGVFSATSAPSGFQNVINYQASVTAPTAASVNANASTPTPTAGATASTSGATSNTGVLVTIDPTPNPLPLVAASDYADTLTVSITPQ